MRASARELGAVDDVAAIARQLHAAALLGRRGARLGELAGDAADLHHRRAAGEGQHHRHLQEDAEEVADVVGAVLGEALGAIAALQQEGLAGRDLGQRLLQLARLACKNQRRKASRACASTSPSCGLVGIVRHLHDRHRAPAFRRPRCSHFNSPHTKRATCRAPCHVTMRRMPSYEDRSRFRQASNERRGPRMSERDGVTALIGQDAGQD